MDISWSHAAPSILAAFFASLVEFVEALTVILAVGSIRGWRSALTGTTLAIVVLLGIVAALGPTLARIPIGLVQIIVGVLLAARPTPARRPTPIHQAKRSYL